MRLSHDSSEVRNEFTMISMATIRLKLVTMAAMPIAAWRGVACNWATASAAGANRGSGRRRKQADASQGRISTAPIRMSAMAA